MPPSHTNVRPQTTLPILLLAAGCVLAGWWLLGFAQTHPTGVTDETDILSPAVQYISGHITANVKYPSFPFYFYGSFLRVAGLLAEPDAALALARRVNIGLYVVTLVLTFVAASQIFSRTWALLVAAMLATLPGTLLAGQLVKTESLQLAELAIVLVAILRVNAGAGRAWQVVAGAGAALLMATKLNPIGFVLWGFNALWLWRHGRGLQRRDYVLYSLASLVTLLGAWTNLWIFPQIVTGWQGDLYVKSGAGPLTAVDEAIAFPWGRFSSLFSMVLPQLIGGYVVLVAGSLFLVKRSSWLHAVFGAATAVTLVATLATTRLRMHHTFTLYQVYCVFASVAFLRALLAGNFVRSRPVRLALGAAAFILIGAQATLGVVRAPAYAEGILNHAAAAAKYFTQPDTLIVVGSIPEVPGSKREDLQRAVKAHRPEYIYIYGAYPMNMCKYRHRTDYAASCRYFQRLLAGTEPFELVERHPILHPYAVLSPDPEMRESIFYVFRRRDM